MTAGAGRAGAGPYWTVCGEMSLPAGTGWLTAAEARRAAALVFPKRRTEYLLRRLAAKRAVAAVTGRPADPAGLARIEVANTPGGAPYVLLDGAPADFDVSLADRAGWAVCAVGSRIGCDLELVEPRSPAFIRDYLTPAEQRFVAAGASTDDRAAGASTDDRAAGASTDDRAAGATADDRAAAANLIWSAKESALKVLGTGLRRDTRSVEVSAGPAEAGGWGRLTVGVAGGAPLTGWWRREGAFLVTLTTAVPTGTPVPLDRGAVLAGAAPRHSWLGRPSPR